MKSVRATVERALTYMFRRAREHPLLTAAPAVVIACGLAAFCVMYGMVDLVLFRPLPFPDSDRLVAIYAVIPAQQSSPAFRNSWNRRALPWAALQSLKDSDVFEAVGAWARVRPTIGLPATDVVETWFVSSSLLRLLGAEAELGRSFAPAEDDDLSSDAVVLSYECWRTRYGAKPDVLGSRVVLSLFVGEPRVKTVIGVLGPGLRLRGESPEFLLPIGQYIRSASSHNRGSIYAIGRLRDQRAVDAATALAASIIPRTLLSDLPASGRAVSLRDDILGSSGPPAWLVAMTAGILLLVTCTSVAGILLGSVERRRSDIAVQLALGATGRSVAAQLFTEHLLTTFVGATCGLVLSYVLMPALTAIASPELIRTDSAHIDRASLLVGLLIVGLTTVAVGAAPAFMVSVADPARVLFGGRQHGTRSAMKLQRIIASSQLALALVLLVSAILLAQTLIRLRSRPLGFDGANLAVLSIKVSDFPEVPLSANELPIFSSRLHIESMLAELKRVPGVVSAAGVSTAPFSGAWQSRRIRAMGHPASEYDVQLQIVTADYFQTMGIRLLAGRYFTQGDRQSSLDQPQIQVLVSRELDRVLGGGSVGMRLQSLQPSVTLELVGVVEDVRQRDLDEASPAALYLLNSNYAGIGQLIVKTASDPGPLLSPFVNTIRAYDSATIVTGATTMDALLAKAVAEERFRAVLAGLFGGVAFVLAVTGVYSLGLRIARNRRRDTGIRIALGATPRGVCQVVFRDVGYIVGLGLALGLPAAMLTAYGLRRFLFGISPLAAHVFIVAAGVLSVASLLALLLPAWRSSRADPAVILRD